MRSKVTGTITTMLSRLARRLPGLCYIRTASMMDCGEGVG